MYYIRFSWENRRKWKCTFRCPNPASPSLDPSIHLYTPCVVPSVRSKSISYTMSVVRSINDWNSSIHIYLLVFNRPSLACLINRVNGGDTFYGKCAGQPRRGFIGSIGRRCDVCFHLVGTTLLPDECNNQITKGYISVKLKSDSTNRIKRPMCHCPYYDVQYPNCHLDIPVIYREISSTLIFGFTTEYVIYYTIIDICAV